MKKEIREQVYNKYQGHCAYCGKKIEYKDMQLDHIIPQWHLDDVRFNWQWDKIETIENYMPSCRRCNHYKRGSSLETFRKMIEEIPSKLFRDNYIFKVACDYGLFNSENQKIKFYFETVESEGRNG